MEQIDSLLITGSNGFVGQSFLNYLFNLPKEKIPREIFLVNRNPPIRSYLNSPNKTSFYAVQADLTLPWKFNFKVSRSHNLIFNIIFRHLI